MGWIFDTCTDIYGSCIRQYINFTLCLLVLILALYSSISTYKSQKLNFQLLPLIINTISCMILLGLYSQMQVYNIRIVLLIIQIYSYFILCYSFVFMVIKSKFNYQDKSYQQKTQKFIKKIFYIVSGLILISIILTLILSFINIITCQQDQGLASIIIIILELPLLIITFIYSHKSKKIIIYQSNFLISKKKQARITEHIINSDDTYIQLKLLQLKYVRFAFVVSLVLHLIQFSCYYIGGEQIICLGQTNKVQITNALQLYILCIQNLSQLFPHFIIPFIFWYIPAKIYKQKKDLSQQSDYDGLKLTPQINQSSPSSKPYLSREQSNLVPDLQNQENIRQKLIHGTNIKSPNRQTY